MKKMKKHLVSGIIIGVLLLFVSTKSFAGLFVGFPYGIPSSGVSVTVSGSGGSWSHYFTSTGPWQIDTGLPVFQGYTVTVSGSATFYDAEAQIGYGSSFYYSPWRYVGIKMN